jgi:hypothetical protein
LPALREVDIRLFNDIVFEIPQFCQVVLRLNTLRLDAVAVEHYKETVRVRVYLTGKSSNRVFLLETQISSQLSHLISSLRSLEIGSLNGLPTGAEDVDPTQLAGAFSAIYSCDGRWRSGAVIYTGHLASSGNSEKAGQRAMNKSAETFKGLRSPMT